MLLSLFLPAGLYAQTTTLSTSYPNNDGGGQVTFNFRNNNPYTIVITEIGSICGVSGTQNVQVSTKSQPIAGLPGPIITGLGWYPIGLAVNTITGIANTSTTTAQVFFPTPTSPFNVITIPAGQTRGFSVSATNLRYSILPPGTYIESAGGCDIITGDTIGYAGPPAPNSPVIPNRGFIGYIKFNQAGNCSSPPVAGNVIASSTGICSGQSSTLNISGGSSGLNQLYEWAEGVNSTGPFTPIGLPLSSPAITVTPAATTWYICKMSCGIGTAITSPFCVTVNGGALPGGSYTINQTMPTGGTNYHSFSDAISAMACGVAGPVTFVVAPGTGPYNEQVVIPQILGT